jgi:hypothetical protein
MARMKRIIKAIAFVPLQVAVAYAKLLSRMRGDWVNSWNDALTNSLATQTTEVFHGGGGALQRQDGFLHT